MNEQQMDRALNFSTALFRGILNPKTQRPMTWFFCFGSLLRMVRNKGKMKDDDIDIGILYDEYNQKLLENSIVACGMQIKKRVVNDIDKRPLYYTLKSHTLPIEICVFCWYKHKNILYHTYDIEGHGKERPEKYTFKGIPAWILESGTVDMRIEGSLRQARVPKMYGSALDIWYPDWLTKRKGESETRHLIEMKSCKQFLDESYTKIPAKSKVTGKVWIDGQICGDDADNG